MKGKYLLGNPEEYQARIAGYSEFLDSFWTLCFLSFEMPIVEFEQFASGLIPPLELPYSFVPCPFWFRLKLAQGCTSHDKPM